MSPHHVTACLACHVSVMDAELDEDGFCLACARFDDPAIDHALTEDDRKER